MPKEYFSPKVFDSREVFLTPETHAIHHYQTHGFRIRLSLLPYTDIIHQDIRIQGRKVFGEDAIKTIIIMKWAKKYISIYNQPLDNVQEGIIQEIKQKLAKVQSDEPWLPYPS